MEKTLQKILCLSWLFCAAIIFSAFKAPIAAEPPVVSLSITGKPWVEKCLAAHPEIVWLAGDGVRCTEEGRALATASYSLQFFGKNYPEFDRCLATLNSMKQILQGDEAAYLEFVAAQPKEKALTFAHFQELHLWSKKLLHSRWGGLSERQLQQTFEAGLVLGDLGKSPKAREIFRPFGPSAPDHDDFYGEMLAVLVHRPRLCPTFAALPVAGQQLLLKTANLAHFGHCIHLEGGLEMLTHLQASHIASQDLTALEMDLFIHLCDVAGAAGHVNKSSSLMYTEETHHAIQALFSSIYLLKNPATTSFEVLDSFLRKRAADLGLNPEIQSERVLVRMGTWLRLFNPSDGATLKKSLSHFNEPILTHIITQLDVRPENFFYRTPTYIPAVFLNLLNNSALGATHEERLTATLVLGLPFVTKVLAQHKILLESGALDKNVPLNFNPVAGLAKSDPAALKRDFTIDREGNVLIKKS